MSHVVAGRMRFNDGSLSASVRLGALKAYRRHLTEQFADRCAFWALKSVSGDPDSGVLVIMTDGADQAKFALPRDPGLRSAYRVSNLFRPRCKIHGCWAFGYSLNIAVLDEVQKHDSSCVLELIAQTLETVNGICIEQGTSMPHTLLVLGDNTVRELKNQYCLNYFQQLVAKYKMRHL